MTTPVRPARKIISGSGWVNPLEWENAWLESASHLEVWADDTLLTLGADYSVIAAAGSEVPAQVGLNDPAGFGGELVDVELVVVYFVLVLRPPVTQSADLSSGGRFGIATEAAIDAIVRRIQALEDRVNRAVKTPLTEAVDAPDLTIEKLAVGRIWKADADGNMVDGGPATDVAAAVAAIDAEEAAAILAINNAEATVIEAAEIAALASVGALVDDAEAAASTATTQAGVATTQAGLASASALAAEAARDAALAAYDNFDDRFLGSKTSDPTLDNDGNALVAGSLYFNSVDGAMKVYTGSAWVAAYVSGGGFALLANNGSDYVASTFRANLDLYSTAEVLALYQPLAATLTSWASVTRASGFDTFAATPSSANLRALLTDEVGTGAAYFVGGALGTPASATLTNATGLPISGITGSTSASLGVGSLELGHATDTTLSRIAAGVMAVEGVAVPTISSTSKLTNKHIPDRVYTITDAAGFAIDPTNGDLQKVTLGANRTPTVANWVDGDSVTLLVADGTAYTITWTTIGVVWKGGTAPTLAATGFTEINITRENGVYRGVHVGDFAS